jgi:hypothetical protein
MPQTSAIDTENKNVAVLKDIDSSKPERDQKDETKRSLQLWNMSPTAPPTRFQA